MNKDVVDYKKSVQSQARSQYKAIPTKQLLEAKITYFFPDRRRRDHLNANKALLDALQGIVYEDDKQIVNSLHITYSKPDKQFLIDKINPRIELEFEEI